MNSETLFEITDMLQAKVKAHSRQEVMEIYELINKQDVNLVEIINLKNNLESSHIKQIILTIVFKRKIFAEINIVLIEN